MLICVEPKPKWIPVNVQTTADAVKNTVCVLQQGKHQCHLYYCRLEDLQSSLRLNWISIWVLKNFLYFLDSFDENVLNFVTSWSFPSVLPWPFVVVVVVVNYVSLLPFSHFFFFYPWAVSVCTHSVLNQLNTLKHTSLVKLEKKQRLSAWYISPLHATVGSWFSSFQHSLCRAHMGDHMDELQ